jgi:hypothetical protein
MQGGRNRPEVPEHGEEGVADPGARPLHLVPQTPHHRTLHLGIPTSVRDLLSTTYLRLGSATAPPCVCMSDYLPPGAPISPAICMPHQVTTGAPLTSGLGAISAP